MHRHSVRLIKLRLQLGILGYVEQPWSSRLWLIPGTRWRIASQQGWVADLDQRHYNRRRRKPTRTLFWGIPPQGSRFLRCSGKRGRCSRHVQLTVLYWGRFATAAAQEHPPALRTAPQAVPKLCQPSSPPALPCISMGSRVRGAAVTLPLAAPSRCQTCCARPFS